MGDHAKCMRMLKRVRKLTKVKAAGNAAFKARDFTGAVDAFSEALALDPDHKSYNAKLHPPPEGALPGSRLRLRARHFARPRVAQLSIRTPESKEGTQKVPPQGPLQDPRGPQVRFRRRDQKGLPQARTQVAPRQARHKV